MIDPSLPGLGLWLEQLVAESTGKHGSGILPVAEEPPGDPGSYGEDRVFMWITDVGQDGGQRGEDSSNDTRGRVQAYARAKAHAPDADEGQMIEIVSRAKGKK